MFSVASAHLYLFEVLASVIYKHGIFICIATTKWTVTQCRRWITVIYTAHLFRYKPRDITVRLGEYDFTEPGETRALDFMVTEIRMHRDFRLNTYENDIGIIKIHRSTTFNSYIWPICLPPVQYTFENKNAVVTGQCTKIYITFFNIYKYFLRSYNSKLLPVN